MASPVGGQYVFFEPDGTRINLALTADGSDLPDAVAGSINIEVFTTAAASLAPGYQGSAFAPGAVADNSTLLGAVSLQLLAGDFAVAGGSAITLGSGAQKVVAAVGDTVTGGSGAGFIDASAGSTMIQIGSTGGSDTIFSGHFDTIRGGADSATIVGAAGDAMTSPDRPAPHS